MSSVSELTRLFRAIAGRDFEAATECALRIAENEENNKILLVQDEGWHVLGNAEITLLVDRGNYIQVYYDIEGEYVDHYRLQWSTDSKFNTLTGEIPYVSGERGWINVMDYKLEGPCPEGRARLRGVAARTLVTD